MNLLNPNESKEEYFPSGNRYVPPNANPDKPVDSTSNNYKPVKAAESKYDLSKANHPIVCVFTILFKGLAILR